MMGRPSTDSSRLPDSTVCPGSHRVSLTVPVAREVTDRSGLVSNEASTVRSSANACLLAVVVSGLTAAANPSGVGVGMSSEAASTPTASMLSPVSINGVRILVFMRVVSFRCVRLLSVSRR